MSWIEITSLFAKVIKDFVIIVFFKLFFPRNTLNIICLRTDKAFWHIAVTVKQQICNTVTSLVTDFLSFHSRKIT